MMTLLSFLLFSGDVSGLADTDYRVRDAAEARLSRYAWLALPAVDRHFTDPEQRRRARRVVQRATRLSATPTLTSLDPRYIVVCTWQHSPCFQYRCLDGPAVMSDGGFIWATTLPDGLARRLNLPIVNTPCCGTWVDADAQRDVVRCVVARFIRAGVPAPLVRLVVDVLLYRESLWSVDDAEVHLVSD